MNFFVLLFMDPLGLGLLFFKTLDHSFPKFQVCCYNLDDCSLGVGNIVSWIPMDYNVM